MPPCEIDVDACPKFLPLVKRLKKKYRRIEQDLKQVFEEIERDYETAAGAAPIPGWEGTVWKHRCGSTDMRSGRSGGFRIISMLVKDRDPHVLFPLLIYAKPERTDVTAVEIAEGVKALRRELAMLEGGDQLGLGEGFDSGAADATQ